MERYVGFFSVESSTNGALAASSYCSSLSLPAYVSRTALGQAYTQWGCLSL
jgi:acyl CoA:acetate/3-ketoacid CoA transferase alpha subunit